MGLEAWGAKLLGRLSFLLRMPFAPGGAGQRAQHTAEHTTTGAVAAAVVVFADIARATPAASHDRTVLGGHLLVCVTLLY